MRDLEPALERMRAAEAPAIELLTEPPPAPPRSLALLSGSFDPITVAHVGLAESALETSDAVVLLYSVRTLHKEGRGAELPPLLTELERLDTLVGLCARRRGFAAAVCSGGLLVDQVEAVADAFPGAELSVAVGSDKLLQLFDPRWYEDRDGAMAHLFDRARLRYTIRGGDGEAVAALLGRAEVRPWRERIEPLPVPDSVADVSSSRVRDLIRRGEDVSRLIPEEAHAIVKRRIASIAPE